MVLLPLWALWLGAGLAFAMLAYGIYMVNKLKKSQGIEPSQLDGTVTGEGTIAHDIAGSPHLYGNDVDLFNFDTEAIKQKGGKK